MMKLLLLTAFQISVPCLINIMFFVVFFCLFFLILTITNFNFEIVLFLFEIMFVLPLETTLSL